MIADRMNARTPDGPFSRFRRFEARALGAHGFPTIRIRRGFGLNR